MVAVGDSFVNLVDAGSGKPILFVHGFPLDHSMWRFQIEAFAKRNRVICPDLPGYGSSPAGNRPTSMRAFADVLVALLDALNVTEPIVYCGLSMGGYIGWQIWMHHSDRLSHLVACDTRAGSDSIEIARGRRIAAQSVQQTGSQAVADAMISKLFYRPDDPERKSMIMPVHEVMSKTDPESISTGQLAMAERPDATSWLGEITLPMLFVVGEHDKITPYQEMLQNSNQAPDSRILQISEAGHMSPLENHASFNEGLREFLDSN